ncbi:MAG TPA: alpha/beta fold hydrolase [Thermoanaerobaculia bacterium]|nr:alpha/beta fold hydrolase [Thermoanaerobaculia bacterium]
MGEGHPEERLIKIAPFRFWVTRAGEEGSPIVLLHGLAASRSWWTKNLPALAERHRVSAVDLIGFGRNRRFVASPLPLSFGELIPMLGRWLDSFDQPVHLFGHSMGGQIALRLAVSRPDRVRSLVLVASTGIPFSLDPVIHLREFLRPPPSLLRFSPILAWDFLRAGPSSVMLAWARLMRDDTRPLMSGILAPTLLVWGENDPLVPLRYGWEMHERIPHSRMIVLPRAGHVAMWDAAEAFNRQALEFIESVERSPAPSLARGQADFGWGVAGCDAGICYRQSGPDPRVVLIHGLGLGTRYFRRLAHAFLDRAGIRVIAPDLPGFGYTPKGQTAPAGIADRLAAWITALEAPPFIWVGHSTGCHVVEQISERHPALVSHAFHLGPIWSDTVSWWQLGWRLFRDAWLEPVALVLEAARAWLRAGPLRVFRALQACMVENAPVSLPPAARRIIAGAEDGLIDPSTLNRLGVMIRIPGAHGIAWSHPEEIVEAVQAVVGPDGPAFTQDSDLSD